MWWCSVAGWHERKVVISANRWLCRGACRASTAPITALSGGRNTAGRLLPKLDEQCFSVAETETGGVGGDETKLRDQFGVVTVGVMFEGRCIPLAWRVYRANRHADYPREGQARMIMRLLKQVRAGLPLQTRVLVLADRGIGTSPLLMRGIAALGWTFLFRVTKQSKIVLSDGQDVTFYDQVDAPGQTYRASELFFKQRGHIPGHVRVLWSENARDRWALVTNDPTLTGWEYAQRMWIEEAFRDLKSHGWQLDACALTDPERLARLWIVLVVAYAWLLFLGQAVVAAGRATRLKRQADGSLVRRWSLFREGWYAFLAASPP